MLKLARGLIRPVLLTSVVAAQGPAGNDAVFRYRGADRDARLVQQAKREAA